MDNTAYPARLLLMPGTIIPRPHQIPGMEYEFYDTLEILDGYPGNWLALARAGRESHVYRIGDYAGNTLRAERVGVR
jgi:hypothetical protein